MSPISPETKVNYLKMWIAGGFTGGNLGGTTRTPFETIDDIPAMLKVDMSVPCEPVEPSRYRRKLNGDAVRELQTTGKVIIWDGCMDGKFTHYELKLQQTPQHRLTKCLWECETKQPICEVAYGFGWDQIVNLLVDQEKFDRWRELQFFMKSNYIRLQGPPDESKEYRLVTKRMDDSLFDGTKPFFTFRYEFLGDAKLKDCG